MSLRKIVRSMTLGACTLGLVLTGNISPKQANIISFDQPAYAWMPACITWGQTGPGSTEQSKFKDQDKLCGWADVAKAEAIAGNCFTNASYTYDEANKVLAKNNRNWRYTQTWDYRGAQNVAVWVSKRIR
jgi:hypothetical protein